jgi:glycosyltransferase involved in cell wall biosynthesis
MKRVLFLAYLFPPIANSGTQRPLKFAKYLSRYGWEPTVVTAERFDDHPTDPSLLQEMAADQRIIRVPMLDHHITDAISMMTLGSAFGKRLTSALTWRLRTSFEVPDLYALWKPTAKRAALKLYREHGFDAIYATGFPWTSLLIGRDVSKATGRPLIADFRDPWAGDDLWQSSRTSHSHELALERSVVTQASAVVSVSTTMTKSMKAAHPHVDQSKFITIHNGFDPIDMNVAAPAQRSNKFRIVYTGVWKDGYNPSRLYDVLEDLLKSSPDVLRNTEVLMAGFTPGEALRRGLDSVVSEVGRLSHHDALALMYSADMLFFAAAESAYQRIALPGKMYEYLATGRPVLALAHPDGDIGRLLNYLGGGVAVSSADSERFKGVIARACIDGRLAVEPVNREALSAFERPNLAMRLAAVLDAITAGAPLPEDATWLPHQVSLVARE